MDIPAEKICSKCGIDKPISEFRRQPSRNNKPKAACIVCEKEGWRRWKANNKDHVANYMKKWRDENKESVAAACKKRGAKWYAENKEKVIERAKRWDIENPEKARVMHLRSAVKWQGTHPEKAKEVSARARQKRRLTPKVRISDAIGNGIRASLRGSKEGRHWESLVGFTVRQLRKHLEKKFSPEMAWGNYGTVWEIDHKVPIAVFSFERPEDIDFRKCWSLGNLQPLGVSENRIKNKKIGEPHQPSLLLAVQM